MRKVLFALIFIVLFTIACSQVREHEIRQLEAVRVYEAINGGIEYSERVFEGDDAVLFADVVRAECPNGVGTEFVRAEIKSAASSLIIYTDASGENITCSVLKPKEAKEPVIKAPADAPAEGVALSVNGERIMIQQIQAALAQLPESTPRDGNTINLVVNQLVNNELLRQEAAKVEVDAAAVAEKRAAIMAAANITEEQLVANLAQQGITAAEFDAAVKEEAQLDALLDARLLLGEIEISDESARQYYLENPSAFLQSEQAVMRQVFISAQNRSAAQVESRAQQVAGLLNTTDFCELVTRFSDDAQSRQNCGVYVIPRGAIDPNLEMASFTTPVNQTSVVTTQGGLHFVQTLQVTPANVVPYNQVAASLQQDLRNAVLQQRLNLYIQTLRADAEIVSYLG